VTAFYKERGTVKKAPLIPPVETYKTLWNAAAQTKNKRVRDLGDDDSFSLSGSRAPGVDSPAAAGNPANCDSPIVPDAPGSPALAHSPLGMGAAAATPSLSAV
jgi:hypothetical protein